MGKTTGNDSGQGGTAKVIVLALPSAAQVEPPVGWEPNCKYGLQRIDATPGGRLVRLEDIAEWLAQSLPRKEVIHRLALELVGDDGAATKCLYVLSSQTFAIPLVADGYPNPKADGFWQWLPSVDRKTLPEYIGRDVCAAWERAWPGLANPQTDRDWVVQRAIAKNLERNAREIANLKGVEHGYEDWPEDEFLLERLRTLAIPVAEAFELWGYGVMATAVQQVAETTADKWTPERLKAERAALEAGGSKSPMKTLSAKSGIPDRKIRHLIAKASTSTAPTNSVFAMGKKVKRKS